MAEKTADNNYTSFACKKQVENGEGGENCDKVIKNKKKEHDF